MLGGILPLPSEFFQMSHKDLVGSEEFFVSHYVYLLCFEVVIQDAYKFIAALAFVRADLE